LLLGEHLKDLKVDQVVNGAAEALRNTRLSSPLNKERGPEEKAMPVILLWGIPTLFVVAGGGWWLMHMHH